MLLQLTVRARPAVACRRRRVSRWAGAFHRQGDAGRARGRGGRLRQPDDRCGKRHRTGHRAGPPDGHPLGHERQARHGPAYSAAEQLGRPCRAWRQTLQRRDGKAHRHRVARIIKECHEDAKRLLGEHRASLDALVAALIQRESLDEKEILEVTGLPAAPLLPDRPTMSDFTAEAAPEPAADRPASSRERR
jgi:hypothetical protein